MNENFSEISNIHSTFDTPEDFEKYLELALDIIPEARGSYISLALVDNYEIQRLNSVYREIDAPTDVLSFPADSEEFEDEDFLGEIVISVDRAIEQASESGLPIEIELKQLVLHGILHLCGYDHEADNGEMNKLELNLRAKLAIDS